MKRYLAVVLLILAAGCSVQQPADTSDPAASAKWIAQCRKNADKSFGLEKAAWLMKAYEHAAETGLLGEAEQDIPNQVLQLSKQAGNFEGFTWALDHGGIPSTHYTELAAYDEMGRPWRDAVYAARPETLPVFMSLASDRYDRKFFEANAAKLMKQGFQVKSPLETTEFKMRYRKFVGVQLEEALAKGDEEKVRFLISVTPPIDNIHYVDRDTQRRMKAAADYVFDTLKDEELAVELLRMNWPMNAVDFEHMAFGERFLEAYRANPEFALRTQGWTEWDGRMSAAEARFLTTLPEEAWALLPKLHFDELLEESVKMTESDAAARVIAFKAKQKPFSQADYNELVNWALKHGNKSVFDYVIRESGELDIFNIDLGSLAENQKLFQYYAPKILSNLYYTMDTEPKKDGTTLGRLKGVFGAKNENAGLWLVYNYDLSEKWAEASGGQTLLMDVCEQGNLKTARYLIEKRGESVHTETGYSALQMTLFGSTRPTEGRLSAIFFAAQSGNPELVKYLASKGANVNARSNFHTTPLMHAVTAGHYEVVKTLLALRADVNAQMNPNLNDTDLRKLGSFNDISNAYRRARSRNDQKMLQILTAAGAAP